MNNIYDKLKNLQLELKAPKSQKNTFGKYNYRSNEDILESIKPLLNKYNLSLTQSDDVVEIGGRLYVKATITLINIDNLEEKIVNTAFAREEQTKKGMDGSQITGASSSYARKYAMNGLFAIDDTKDSDATNKGGSKETPKKEAPKLDTKLVSKAKELNVNFSKLATYKKKTQEELTNEDLKEAIQKKGGK